jgi:hypothetical protein
MCAGWVEFKRDWGVFIVKSAEICYYVQINLLIIAMETNKHSSSAVEPPKRVPLLFVFAVIAIIVLIAGAFYLYFTKSAIQEEQNRLDADITSLQGEITALEDQKIQLAQGAQSYLEEIKKEEILWSGVITKIQTLIPVDQVTQAPKVYVLSYSGSGDGKIMLNLKSAGAQIEPWESVAELISAFNNSSYFATAFVPGINRGETDQGKKELNFTMTVDYTEDKPVELSASSSDTETKPKVPRQ